VYKLQKIKTEQSVFRPLLAENAPETIWTLGNLSLLQNPLIGFFCSVKCPGTIILRIYDLIRALRDAGIPVIGGFQSPMEKECLDLLLRGDQPIVICPARSIENMRIPKAWQTGIDQGQLLLLSPFEPKHKRPTTQLTEQRNRFVAALSNKIVIGHATKNGKIATLCSEWIDTKHPVYTLDMPDHIPLIQQGVIGKNLQNLVLALK